MGRIIPMVMDCTLVPKKALDGQSGSDRIGVGIDRNENAIFELEPRTEIIESFARRTTLRGRYGCGVGGNFHFI